MFGDGIPSMELVTEAIRCSCLKGFQEFHKVKNQLHQQEQFNREQNNQSANSSALGSGSVLMDIAKKGKQQYEITVKTSELKNSGTKAGISLTLFNLSNESTDTFTLTMDALTNEARSANTTGKILCRGQTDVFIFTSDSESVGSIDRLRLANNNEGLNSSWLPESVVVKDLESNFIYSFKCDEWLTMYGSTPQIVKDFTKQSKFYLTNSDFAEVVERTISCKDDKNKVFSDYAPKVFSNIRALYNIGEDEYIKSWKLSKEMLDLKEGAGRSGSLFLQSVDKKYMLKTIPYDELVNFLQVLESMYKHLLNNKHSYIMKVLGLFKVKDLYVLVFTNCIFHHNQGIERIYDLKGRKPKAGKQFQNTDKGADYVFKDKDLDRKFQLDVDSKIEFLDILRYDLAFFAHNNLMDYSFLIGVAKRDPEDEGQDLEFITRYNNSNNEVYYIGWIDCLTKYTLKKKTAHFMKRALWSSEELSTVNAQLYAERIGGFLMKIFGESEDHHHHIPNHSIPKANGPDVMGVFYNEKFSLLEHTISQMKVDMREMKSEIDSLNLQLLGIPHTPRE